MSNTSLENLAAYTTPVQSQQSQPDPQTEEQEKDREDTPGQKRKRNAAEQKKSQRDKQPQTRCQPPMPASANRELPTDQVNHTRNTHTPSPAGPVPSYELPQYNRAHTPSLPPSPTNEAQKRRRLLDRDQNTRVEDQVQEMAVDEEGQHTVDQGDTPTMASKRRWHEDGHNGQGEPPAREEAHAWEKEANITVEVDELANAKTLARILTVTEKLPSGENSRALRDPLSKYTEGPMPDIHDEDPATLLARLDKVQLQSWLDLPTGKVLARPFDSEVNYRPNHQGIAQDLAEAVREITGATKVAIAPPNKDKDVHKRERHPITFLIHNISKEDVETLLEWKVWSSKEITFQVAPINISRPEFLFTLKGFTSPEVSDVAASLAEIWGDPVTKSMIRKLASDAPNDEEQQEWNDQMTGFLESATVRYLDIKGQGGRAIPHFNVYANGDIIEDDETWLQLRKYLRNRVYKTTTIGTGRTVREDFVCGLCHGHDHPRGLCPFPHVQGWNGGNRAPKRPRNTNTQGFPHPLHPHAQLNTPTFNTRTAPTNTRRRY